MDILTPQSPCGNTRRRILSRAVSAIALLVLGLILGLARPVDAQAQDYVERIGVPNWTPSSKVTNGTVAIANGNLHIEIPMASYPQRGGSTVKVRLAYDSRLWTEMANGWEPLAPFNALGGWKVLVGEFNSVTPCNSTDFQVGCGGIGYASEFLQCSDDGVNFKTYVETTGFSWSAPDGMTKTWTGLATYNSPCVTVPDTPNATAYADDGSGYYISVTEYSVANVYDPRGRQVWPTIGDTNGNILSSLNSSGNFTDTLGRTPVTGISQNGNVTTITLLDPLNPQGSGTAQFVLTTKTINVSTAFTASFHNEFSGTLTVAQSFQLPNGQTYTFGYDSGTTAGHYGTLTSMTLPTGATDQYAYSPFTDYGCEENLWLVSYTSLGNTTSFGQSISTPPKNCNEQGVVFGSGQQVTVDNPDGSSQIYQFTFDGFRNAYNTVTNFYDTTGSLLETTSKQYTSFIFFPASITTTVPSSTGSISKMSQYSYDNIGWHNVSQVQEWDWFTGSAPSTPTRVTNATYTAANSAYAAQNILNLPTNITVTDGSGNAIAQTAYTYDGASPACTTGVASHPNFPCPSSALRGNLTQESHWLNTSNVWLNTTHTYDDTGNLLSTTDPNGNTTTFGYADNFYNFTPSQPTDAYLTKITYPSANGVAHVRNYQYYFGTGQKSADCGENFPAGTACSYGLGAPQPDYTTYTYDSLERPLVTFHGDGGQTAITYNDTTLPLSLTSTKKIDSSQNLTATTILDTLGRTSSVQVTTPPGTVSTDTTYDSMGRVSTVSNPHFIGSTSPTDGITTTQYDGLRRVTLVTEQDGGQSTITYSGNSVTTVDPAGKQRRTFTDGLGRLTEVDEPSSNANATPGTGSSTVSGSEQISSGTGAAPGSGTVTISGTEAFTLVGTKPNQTKVYDAGTVSITVNGSTESVTYGQSSTNSGVAAGLAATINNNHSFPVTASASGTTITLTATTTGTSTDYSLSATSATTDPTQFLRASFSATASGSALTGGSNGSGQTYDAGTVSVSVNGHTDSTTYGQGSTAAALAAALVSAINGDSSASVTASASGAAITLTAASIGANTNYSLSAGSSTNYPTIFSSPSFSISVSSSTLTGGTTPNLFSSPNVTLYTYDLLDNLICVEQHGNVSGTGCSSAPSNDATSPWRVRRFAYDSLSRQTSAKNPESGTISYTYDSDGNEITETDARGIVTTLVYDQLNRLNQKTYSDSTPTVSIGYDGIAPSGCSPTLSVLNGIGRRTGMCDAAGWEAWQYDSMGRVSADRRNTNGITNNTAYAYNAAGNMTSITYPTGRTITYTINPAEQMTSAVDSANGITYASRAGYNPPGDLNSMLNGTGSNLVSTLYYTKRLQPCRISVSSAGISPTSCVDSSHIGNVLDFTYSYNLSSSDDGNVASIANNLNSARSQTYAYDQLSRLSSAQTQATSGTYAWGQSFSYDAWANLLGISVTQGSSQSLSVVATLQNQIQGFCYDAAGNLLDQGACPGGSNPANTYSYNAESQMTATAGVVYIHDGDGNRAEKSSGKLYWYDTDGNVLDETDLSGNLLNEYIFFNGGRIARRDSSNNVFYYFSDHLGTAREVLEAGQTSPCYDADFSPFGGEFSYSNTCTQNYKFTSKERDSESGLDDFLARHYASQIGRFLSIDPDNASGRDNQGDPQSWNAYSYARNNPINLTDPSGAEYCGPASYDSDGNQTAAAPCVSDREYQENPGKFKDYKHYFCSCDELDNHAYEQSRAHIDYIMRSDHMAQDVLGDMIIGTLSGNIVGAGRGLIAGLAGNGVREAVTVTVDATLATATDATISAGSSLAPGTVFNAGEGLLGGEAELSLHAAEQAAKRGVTSDEILEALSHVPKQEAKNGSVLRFIGKAAEVRVNRVNGIVVTVIRFVGPHAASPLP